MSQHLTVHRIHFWQEEDDCDESDAKTFSQRNGAGGETQVERAFDEVAGGD